jgi:hypothetical protein
MQTTRKVLKRLLVPNRYGSVEATLPGWKNMLHIVLGEKCRLFWKYLNVGCYSMHATFEEFVCSLL